MKFCATLSSALALAFILLFSQNIYACGCELQLSNTSLRKQVKEARENSQAIFTGTVLDIIKPLEKTFLLVKMKVALNWKGADSYEITITTGRGDGDCGFPFITGQKYLVYAYQTASNQI